MSLKHDCSEKIWKPSGNWGYESWCRRNATVEENGRWWCAIHAPSKVAEREKKLCAKWKVESDARNAKYRYSAELSTATRTVINAAKKWAQWNVPENPDSNELHSAVTAYVNLEESHAK